MLPLIFLLYGVVWLARAIMLARGVYYGAYVSGAFLSGRWASALGLISSFGLIVPIPLWLLSNRVPRWRRWAWLAAALEIAWVLPTGRRLQILETLFMFLLVAWWSNQRIPWRKLAALLVAAIIAFPIVGQYRYTIGRFTDVNRMSIGATLGAIQAAQDRFEREWGETTLDSVDSFAERLYDGQFLGYLLKHYREAHDWEYGRTYYTRVPFVFLPYFAFPHRPVTVVHLTGWFPTLILSGALPITFLGEAYINFGYVGVPIMAFLLGMILAAYDVAFRRRQNDIFVLAVYLWFGKDIPYMVTTNLAHWLGALRNTVLLVIALHLVHSLWQRTQPY